MFFIVMMRWFVEQFFERPLAAFISSVEILGQDLKGQQMIDAIVGRIIHSLSCPSECGSERENVVTTRDREDTR